VIIFKRHLVVECFNGKGLKQFGKLIYLFAEHGGHCDALHCIKLYQGRILSQSESIKWISLTLVSARSHGRPQKFSRGQKECLTGRNFPWGGGKLFSNQEIPKICTLIFQKMAKKHDFLPHIFSKIMVLEIQRGHAPPLPHPTPCGRPWPKVKQGQKLK